MHQYDNSITIWGPHEDCTRNLVTGHFRAYELETKSAPGDQFIVEVAWEVAEAAAAALVGGAPGAIAGTAVAATNVVVGLVNGADPLGEVTVEIPPNGTVDCIPLDDQNQVVGAIKATFQGVTTSEIDVGQCGVHYPPEPAPPPRQTRDQIFLPLYLGLQSIDGIVPEEGNPAALSEGQLDEVRATYRAFTLDLAELFAAGVIEDADTLEGSELAIERFTAGKSLRAQGDSLSESALQAFDSAFVLGLVSLYDTLPQDSVVRAPLGVTCVPSYLATREGRRCTFHALIHGASQGASLSAFVSNACANISVERIDSLIPLFRASLDLVGCAPGDYEVTFVASSDGHDTNKTVTVAVHPDRHLIPASNLYVADTGDNILRASWDSCYGCDSIQIWREGEGLERIDVVPGTATSAILGVDTVLSCYDIVSFAGDAASGDPNPTVCNSFPLEDMSSPSVLEWDSTTFAPLQTWGFYVDTSQTLNTKDSNHGQSIGWEFGSAMHFPYPEIVGWSTNLSDAEYQNSTCYSDLIAGIVTVPDPMPVGGTRVIVRHARHTADANDRMQVLLRERGSTNTTLLQSYSGLGFTPYLQSPPSGANTCGADQVGFAGGGLPLVYSRFDIPPQFAGKNAELIFRMGSDAEGNSDPSGAPTGWLINKVEVVGAALRRGDCNSDRIHDVRDVVALVNRTFRSGERLPQLGNAGSTGDINCSSPANEPAEDIIDLVLLIDYVFRGKTPGQGSLSQWCYP